MNEKLRPIPIGIIGKHITNYQINHLTSAMIRDEVIQALTYFGAVPIGILLPTCYPKSDTDIYLNLNKTFSEKEMETIEYYLNLCEGFIFQGGNHLDHYEYELARIIHRRNIPTLGFCGGQTIMISALTSDVEIVDVDIHKHNRPNINHAHNITVVPKTLFSSIVKTDSLQVNSRHHTSIAQLSNQDKHLKVSAISPEGYAEVIEDTSKRFYLSTRFHPESNFHNEFMSRIFRAFITACSSAI